MDRIPVVVPSMGRHKTISTHKVVSDCIVCVPESEKELYKNHEDGYEVIAHPDSVKGLCNKRNWIMDKFGDVFMIDDDVTGMRRIYETEKNEIKDPTLANELIQQLYYTALDVGAKIFSFSYSSNPKHYVGLKPVKLVNNFHGGAFGVTKDINIAFNEEFVFKELNYYALMNMYYHRISYKDTRFAFAFKDTYTGTGGMSTYNDRQEKENEIAIRLTQMFPNVCTLKRENVREKRLKALEVVIQPPF